MNLRKAAEMALEALDDLTFGRVSKFPDARKALRQALAQPEQEFVGACVTCGAPKGEWLVDAVNMSQERVDETAKREWVGLTHEERDEIDQNCRSQMEALFAVEAKLKEKNA